MNDPRARAKGPPTRANSDLGAMAQLVAHLLCKQGVRGSSPLGSTQPDKGIRPVLSFAFLGGEPVLRRGPIVRGSDHQHVTALTDLVAHPIWPILRPHRDLDIDQRVDPVSAQKLAKLQHLRLVQRIIMSVRNQHPARAGYRRSRIFHRSYL